MATTLSESYPSQYESWLMLKNGREVFLRPILRTDGHLLIDLFNKLSPQSRALRFLSQINVLSEDMLYRFTHVNYKSEFALVAVIKEDGKDVIIAVGRYGYDPQANLTDFGIAVRDDWQHQGLGKSLLVKIFAIGKEHGISRFGSVIDPYNNIIMHILGELGYEVKYSPQSGAYQVEILV
jgi:acetyltransferase